MHHVEISWPPLPTTLSLWPQLFEMPGMGKMLLIVAVALPLIIAGGWLYQCAAGGSVGWQEAIGRTYSVLNNCPGESCMSVRCCNESVF
jgi:hypothetical protein